MDYGSTYEKVASTLSETSFEFFNVKFGLYSKPTGFTKENLSKFVIHSLLKGFQIMTDTFSTPLASCLFHVTF